MATGCVMLSPEMFAAIGTASNNSGGDGNSTINNSGNSSYDSGGWGGAGFDDFG